MLQTSSLRNQDAEPQCMKDTKSLLRSHCKTATVGFISALVGALLCICSTPEPRVIHTVQVRDFNQLAKWASSTETLALDLAADNCPDGGRALNLTYNNTEKDFDLDCEAPRLSRRAYVTLGITLTALCLMISGSPPDLCMLAATLALVLWPWKDTGAGIISESEAWQGFSNNGVLTVGALFVVAKAVDETGIVSLVMKKVLGEPKSLFVAQLRLLLPVAISSAFMNNTPIVAMLIPVVIQWAPKMRRNPSTFLMPLSFASMLGGMCSMMGTSTNLVVAGLLAKKNPTMKPFSLFDISVVGGPCALVGVLYMAVMSGCLLPGGTSTGADGNREGGEGTMEISNGSNIEEAGSTTIQERNRTPRSYVVYFVVSSIGNNNNNSNSNSDASGITPVDYGLDSCDMKTNGIFLEGVLRDLETYNGVGNTYRAPTESRRVNRPDSGNWLDFTLSFGDLLVVRVTSSSLASLRVRLSRQGVRLLSELPTLRSGMTQGRRRNQRFLAEAVVGKESLLIGLSRNFDACSDTMMETYGAALISIRDAYGTSGSSKRRTSSVGSFYSSSNSSQDLQHSFLNAENGPSSNNEDDKISVGDVLLVEVFPRCVEMMTSNNHFTLVLPVPGSRPPRNGTTMDVIRMYVAGICLTAMVALSALKVTSLLTAALCASAVLLLFKTITLKTAFSAINGRTLLAIVTTFGVGTAFETTGLANHIATGLIGVFGSFGSVGVLFSVAVVTSVVGCAVSNNAVVILMYPICQTLARDFEGVGLRQLLVVLLVNASSSFLTPMSYQTNLMVFTPGKYKFSDYAKFGALLQLLMLICSVFMAWLTTEYWV
jgi:di/tricarboxylate transporter